MAKRKDKTYHRLPVTFHQTFIPERAHISALLKFAAGGNEGTSTLRQAQDIAPLSVTDQEISAKTGISTGQSSGKVPATLPFNVTSPVRFVSPGRGRSTPPSVFLRVLPLG